VKSGIQGFEDRVRRAELWIIWLTAGIVISGFCSVAVGIFQWSTMRGQLNEMKSSGATS
jgi:uncharacterized membrane protein YhaH (DUF805 family)